MTLSSSPLWGLVLAASLAAQGTERIGFNRHVRPILTKQCFACHGPDENKRKASRRLDTREGALAELDGVRAIVPGDTKSSALLARIRSHDPKHVMPPPKAKKGALDRGEIEILTAWIEQGAGYEEHWSFIPPTAARLPEVERADWSRSPIDRFNYRALQAHGMTPNARVDRRTLIRRVTLDLTGLPPDPEEVEAFVHDGGPDAYQKIVARTLASPHYGERMAVDWMDAARYADTSAYHADGPRQMWTWRDGVTRAFNENQPYDEFTVEQLAGDLIPNSTVEQRVASAFNRNHCTSDEGGAFPEELRVGYIVDRVRTTSMVWLGMTYECAQCHDHKFDPFTNKEYYSFYAFFNQTEDGGMQTRGGNAKPVVDILGKKQIAELPGATAELQTIKANLREQEQAAEPKFLAWLDSYSDPKTVSPQPKGLLAHIPLDGKVVEAVAGKECGTIQGRSHFVDGMHAAGMEFDGKTYVEIGDVADFERTDRFSFGGWVMPEAKGYGAPIARMNDKALYRGYDLYLGAGQGVSMHLIHAWQDNCIKVTTKKKLKQGEWQHVFVTYDGSSRAQGVKIYVDGKLWPVKINNNNLNKTTKTEVPLTLGRRTPGSPYKGRLDDVRFYHRTLSAFAVEMLAGGDSLKAYHATEKSKRTPKMLKPLRAFYLGENDPKWVSIVKKEAQQSGVVARLGKPKTTVMVMKEQAKPRGTFMLDRGQYDSPKGEAILPSLPAALPPLGDRPQNRLGLAQWLVDPNHPLTARVAVNRIWSLFFGRGLVATIADFGAQGAYPSHPKLLDWLAVDFVQHGWDVKRLVRMIVESETYKQSAIVSSDRRHRDPENKWLSRGPRFRLQGEFIRDLALATSGLLVTHIGGPGVKPYQPPGLWNEVSLNRGLRFVQDHGTKLYRRSLYTYWRRSAPPPSMRIFDAPTRERCVMQRSRTDTPLQALVTWNDPQYLEAARHLAARAHTFAHGDIAVGVDRMMRLVLSRPATEHELGVLRGLYTSTLATYRASPEEAKVFSSTGESKPKTSIDPVEHAAWMLVASTILNLDEALTKG